MRLVQKTAYYTFVSATMLVVNKLVLQEWQNLTMVLSCQLLSSSAIVGMFLIMTRSLQLCSPLPFLPIVASFLGIVYFNLRTLESTNIETFVAFRSSTPLVLCVCDRFFSNRQWPTRWSFFSLLFTLFGCVGYALCESTYVIPAFKWMTLWYFCYVFEITYVKYFCDKVPLSNWNRVFYTNLLASLPLIAHVIASGGSQSVKIETILRSRLLALSCIIGTLLSHATFQVRSCVSGTAFSLIGIACKSLSIAMNSILINHTASFRGTLFLVVSMTSAAFYRQPDRK